MAPRTILITGASSGIGRATAELFLQKGWRVGLVGRRAEALAQVADGRDGAMALPCDVTDPRAVDEVFAQFADMAGHLDVLFNNAGVNVPAKPIDELSTDEWASVCDTNISGMFYAARAAFRTMRNQSPQGGRIINNGSISADRPRPYSVPYTMSKHAVSGLTKSLVLDGRKWGVACGQIDIGNAETELANKMKTGVLQPDGSVRAEPMMNVAQVAQTVLHMAEQPEGTNIPFVTVMASNMPLFGRG